MKKNMAQAESDVRSMLHALSEEVQASLALSRAAVAAVAASATGPLLDKALGRELDRARRLVGSPRTTGILEQVQRRLRQMPDEQQRLEALAGALIAAADALPDLPGAELARG